MNEPIAFWDYRMTSIRLDEVGSSTRPSSPLPSEAGEVSPSDGDGGVMSNTTEAHDPSAPITGHLPTLRVGRSHEAKSASAADAPPYTTALLLKLSAALGEIYNSNSPLGLERTARVADILLAHGLALVEPDRHRHWIDETVYSGALFRLRLAEQPPSITLPQDLFI